MNPQSTKRAAAAAVAASAAALMIEVHPSPDHALSDGAQSLDFARFADLMPRLDAAAGAIGRSLARPTRAGAGVPAR